MKRPKWGILGAGRIAHQFASDFLFVEKGELVAVASQSLDRASEFASSYNIRKAYGSYHGLINDLEVNAIYVATPHSMHLENSADALRAGKAVLCEKPLSVNTSEAKELIEIARHHRAYLMEGTWTYFLPAIQKAQEWVEEGRIGKLVQIKADFGYPQFPYDPERREYNKDLGGGCLLELGIYPVALAWLFFGRDPILIKGIGKFASNGVEDDVSVLFDYGETSAILSASFRGKQQNWAYIIGEKGNIAISDFWKAKECLLYEIDTLVDHFCDQRSSLGFNYEIEAVNQDLLSGNGQSDIIPHAATLKFQEHLEAIRYSIL